LLGQFDWPISIEKTPISSQFAEIAAGERMSLRESAQMNEAKDGNASGSRISVFRFLPIAIIAAGLFLGYALGLADFLSLDYLAASRSHLKDFVANNYLLALSSFFFIYVIAVAFSFPAASVLTIFGGFLFGWFVAGVTVAFAATLGATILFWAARYAFADFFMHKIGTRAAAMADGFREDAFSYLLVLRLAPVFPFFVVNIAPAFFNVSIRDYVVATFFGILPGTFAYAFLGQGVDSVLMAAKDAGRNVAVSDLVTPDITIAFAALAAVAAIPLIVKKFRSRQSRAG
jgi:uncharacterized membrane protein YdjX (TVP38/TMEM64 family)